MMTVSFEGSEVESEEFECAEWLVSGNGQLRAERSCPYNLQMKTLCGFRYARRREKKVGCREGADFFILPAVVRQAQIRVTFSPSEKAIQPYDASSKHILNAQ